MSLLASLSQQQVNVQVRPYLMAAHARITFCSAAIRGDRVVGTHNATTNQEQES